MMTDVTYPPLDTPKPVADNVWIVDSGPLRAFNVPLPIRMTVIRQGDGGLLLHSPTRFSKELHGQLMAIGPIRHLVAPNAAHWTMMREWQQEEPQAVAWAAPGLQQRSQVKRSGIRFDGTLGDSGAPGWPPELEQIDVPGIGGFHEIAMFHRPSRTLVLADLVQNLESSKMPLMLRPLLTALGTTAPHGKAPTYLRMLIKLRGEAARRAGARLVGLSPERVIFAHGRWFREDGTKQLQRSLQWLVKPS